MVFLFHCWYVVLGLVRNMKICCSEDLFWILSYWVRDILHENFRLLYRKVCVRYTDHVHKFDHNLFHYVKWFVYRLWHMTGFHSESWRVPRVVQEMLTTSGTHDLTHFREFMISSIHYTCYIYITELVSIRSIFTDLWLVCLPGLVWLLCLGLTFIAFKFSTISKFEYEFFIGVVYYLLY